MRRVLIKFAVATTLFIVLLLLCFSGIDPAFKVMIGAVLVVVLGPSVLLLGIDLSRTINREGARSRSIRAVGKLLAIPQLLFGVIMVAWGVYYPAAFGIHDIATHGRSSAMPIVYTGTSALMFVLGLKYVRDGLKLMRNQGPRDTR